MSGARKGFSLIEIMVSLTILAVVLSSVAKLAGIVAVRGRDADAYAKRSAALQLEANKFGSMPFSTLKTWSTADKSFTISGFSYTRKLTITAPSSNRYTIKIVIVPTSSSIGRDSVFVDRTSPPSSTVLCTGC
jgi:prepilin-type N-terminal cleavage/methylation domain-containing protein